jgi:cytochrome c oxidase subunit II
MAAGRISRTVAYGAAALALLLAGAALAIGAGQPPDQTKTFTIVAKKYTFSPARIEVMQNDLVKIEFRTDDIPHSWTVDAYRISKRANPGQPVTIEFRADKAGTFPFYCNLKIDDGCKAMRGELVVTPRK